MTDDIRRADLSDYFGDDVAGLLTAIRHERDTLTETLHDFRDLLDLCATIDADEGAASVSVGRDALIIEVSVSAIPGDSTTRRLLDHHLAGIDRLHYSQGSGVFTLALSTHAYQHANRPEGADE